MKRILLLLLIVITVVISGCSQKKITAKGTETIRLNFSDGIEEETKEDISVAAFYLTRELNAADFKNYIAGNLKKTNNVYNVIFKRRTNNIIVKYDGDNITLSDLVNTLEGNKFKGDLINRDKIINYTVTVPQ